MEKLLWFYSFFFFSPYLCYRPSYESEFNLILPETVARNTPTYNIADKRQLVS